MVNDVTTRAPERRAAPGTLGLAVEAVLTASSAGTFVSVRVQSVQLDYGGIPGDRHHGLTMRTNSREVRAYARGTEVRNRRQLTLLSAEECADVARRLAIDSLEPEWLGANVLVSGCPEFSCLPVGTRLLFPSGAGLVCEGENLPCRYPGEVVQQRHPAVRGLVRAFVREAYGRRGIVASVERPGEIRSGDRARIVRPPVYTTLT